MHKFKHQTNLFTPLNYPSYFCLWLLFSLLLGLSNSAIAQEADVDLNLIMQQRIQALNNQMVGGKKVQTEDKVKAFYKKRSHQPIWSNGRNLNNSIRAFYNSAGFIFDHGLEPEDYHMDVIGKIIDYADSPGNVLTPDDIIVLEILATDGFLNAAQHLYSGKIDPIEAGLDWHHEGRKFDMVYFLEQALANEHVQYSLELLPPVYQGYWDMVDMLKFYRTVEWAPIKYDKKIFLQRGAKHPIVLKVRERLQSTGDLRPGPLKKDFDWELESALVRFQMRHALLIDGYIKPRTLNALNAPVDNKIQLIKLNMERWRWMPEDMGTDYILVNIPGFELKMMVNDEVDYRERVIVGLELWKTPAFTSQMKYMVINPYWNLPKSIAKNELLPKLQTDDKFIENNDITIFRGEETVDPTTLDFNTINPDQYSFRHGINAFNPLGQIKFMFPNKHAVYLHDTPTRHLFDYTVRSQSHGCIRINEPFKFADYLLYDDNDWTEEKMLAQVESQEHKTVKLKKPIPIYIYYWTAYTDEKGINFREDIYGWDKKMLSSFTKK